MSKLFTKTNKNAPHDADSANARLLIQGGYVNQLSAGIYSYLPLGLRVLKKIQQIIRSEMQGLGAQEIYMPALSPKEPYIKTDRWDAIDVLFKLEAAGGKEYALNPTHEEIVTPLVQEYVRSYKDLPLAVFQIQDKYRNEARAKSGLLRGREFSMKDMYSFHASEEDFEAFYEKAKGAYARVYKRCGLDAMLVEASGGVFSKYSHEYQVATPFGEDTVFRCACGFAQNKEIAEVKAGDVCSACGTGVVEEVKAIEVGNIFPLKTRFTDAFDFRVAGSDGKPVEVLMGCYGIGPSRVMGTIVDVHNDEKGIIWPVSVAPYTVHLVLITGRDEETAKHARFYAFELYERLLADGIDVLIDDRELSPGEMLADADLLGMPLRLVVSPKTVGEDAVEWKERKSNDAVLVPANDVVKAVRQFMIEH